MADVRIYLIPAVAVPHLPRTCIHEQSLRPQTLKGDPPTRTVRQLNAKYEVPKDSCLEMGGLAPVSVQLQNYFETIQVSTISMIELVLLPHSGAI